MNPTQTDRELAAFDEIGQRMQALRVQLGQVIVGQEPVVEALLVALLCQGHVLMVGVPGLAKTLLGRTLAASLNLSFARVQFTPDMMPSDILGTDLIQEDPATGERTMRFAPGPIFTQFLLADEINRAPPRTQSALLEAMAERQVTAGGTTHAMDKPFVVVATQNPIEQEGTYPLPEAQLDRFMFGLWMDYPDLEQEKTIVARTPFMAEERSEPAGDRRTLLHDADLIRRMPVSDHVVDYAVRLGRATRPGDKAEPAGLDLVRQFVAWGAGPRAAQFLVHAAKASAAIAGRPTPGGADVRSVAPAVLRHRLVLNYAAAGEGVDAGPIVEQVIERVQEADYEQDARS